MNTGTRKFVVALRAGSQTGYALEAPRDGEALFGRLNDARVYDTFEDAELWIRGNDLAGMARAVPLPGFSG